MTSRTEAGLGVIALLAILGLRVAVLAGPVPSSIDGGNWLAFGTFARPGIVYPPLVPYLLTGVTHIAGPAVATTVVAVIALSIPMLIVLGVALWSRQPLVGAIAALAIAGSGALGEAVAWGGYPQVIATGTGVGALVALAVYLGGGRRRFLLQFALLFAATVATSHLEAVPSSGAAVLVIVWSARVHGPSAMTRAGVVTLVAALPLLLLSPTYLALFATLGTIPPTSPDPGRILGPIWPIYLAALVAGPIGARAFLVRHQAVRLDLAQPTHAAIVAVVAATIAWSGAFVISGEARLLYDVAVIAPFSLVAMAPLLREALGNQSIAIPAAFGAFIVAAFVAGAGLNAFPDQVAYYRVITPDLFAAMRWLARVPSLRNDGIAVADVRGLPLGWWTEGIVHHEVLFASDLRWLRFPSERARARLANELFFASGFPAGTSASRAETEGVQYVLLPQAAAFGVSSASPPPDWRVVFTSGNALVLEPITANARS